MNILGISAFYHDSAAALVQDGKLVAAAQEERFSRRKHDAAFPRSAIAYCLEAGGVGPSGLDAVAYYDKPLTTFGRLLRTYLGAGTQGWATFRDAMGSWAREKLWIPYQLERGLRDLGYRMPRQRYFNEHHLSHAASAFYPSPFKSAALLTFDGVGEWATSSIGIGRDNQVELLQQMDFPHSIGLLYSAFTYYCGFKVNSGEYKLMGLAPYGEPRYVDRILDNLIDLHPDGSFTTNMRYFGYAGGSTMINRRFEELMGGPARRPESEITRREMDLARSIQAVTEEIILRMAQHAHRVTGERNACLAGGVALNCVANGRLQREGPFDDIWIQPAAGDAGGAIGAAFYAWFHRGDKSRQVSEQAPADRMNGAYLGPEYADDEIEAFLRARDYPHRRYGVRSEWAKQIAEAIAEGKVVGVCYGRMEFGPRALGHRSILGDPRSPAMQSVMNLKIKYRESFRPFAPSVLASEAQDYFGIGCESPYMLLVAPVREEHWVTPEGDGAAGKGPDQQPDDLRAWVNEVRSTLPAITHVDHSARLQTVNAQQCPDYHAIISAFHELTGCPVVINTSFNVRGEPIVNTPAEAYQCFMRTGMDTLVLGSFILDKADQPEWHEATSWRDDYVLD